MNVFVPPSERIKAMVERQFGVSRRDMEGRRRGVDVSEARQTAMFICWRALGLTRGQIGRLFGGRDHTTVTDALQQVGKRLARDYDYKSRMDALLDEAANEKAIPGDIAGLIETISDNARAGIRLRLQELALRDPRDLAKALAPDLFAGDGEKGK